MKKPLRRALALGAVVALVFLGWIAVFALSPIRLASTPLEFHVRPGMTLKGATGEIVRAGAHMPAWKFTLLGRLLGRAGDIKAGSYEIEQGETPLSLLGKLSRGAVALAELKFIEGWTFRQMRAALDAHPALAHETAGLSEAELMGLLGSDQSSAEGWFFPDTYLFDKGSRDLDVLARAHRAMQKILAEEWEARAPGLPYATPYEALIMASIVEKETGKHSDREFVASVFVNRMRLGMPFQTDPSVIYGMGTRFDGNLRKQDLLRDGPFNTYMRAGLPPTPIAMPGMESIRAALHPAETDYLYFVSRGDGSSHFSRDLQEHNRAVTKYQKRKAN